MGNRGQFEELMSDEIANAVAELSRIWKALSV